MKPRMRKKFDQKRAAITQRVVLEEQESVRDETIAHNREKLVELARSVLPPDAGERLAPGDRSPATQAADDLVGDGIDFFELAGTIQWFLHEVDIPEPVQPTTFDEVMRTLRRGLTGHAREFNAMRRELEDLRTKATQLATIQASRPAASPGVDEITGIARVLGLYGVDVKATKILEVANQLASEGLRVELVEHKREPQEQPATTSGAEPEPPAEGEGSPV